MNKNLGFDKEHLLYIKIEGNLKDNFKALKNDFKGEIASKIQFRPT